jgi:hypothetical protein
VGDSILYYFHISLSLLRWHLLPPFVDPRTYTGLDHAFKTDHATREIAAFYRLRRLIKPEQDSCFMRWANL